LDILEINSFTNPIGKEAMQSLLESTLAHIQAKQVAEQQIIINQKEEQKKIYDDPKLTRAKSIVEWIFGRIPNILTTLE
jgi:hypothetical protein